MEDLRILYRDDALMAVDKPSGMLVHRGWAKDEVVLVDLVRDILGVSSVYPVHRLDRQTSGVVLFALSPALAKRIGEAFHAGQIRKTYIALLRGFAPEVGVIDHPVPRGEKGERVDAVTEYRRLTTLDTEPRETSLVLGHPRTGRLHQLRRHFKHISHPIIGDSNYGKGELNRAFAKRYGLCRLALHASKLTFAHPVTLDPIAISSPLPGDLEGPLVRMGLDLSVAGSIALDSFLDGALHDGGA